MCTCGYGHECGYMDTDVDVDLGGRGYGCG